MGRSRAESAGMAPHAVPQESDERPQPAVVTLADALAQEEIARRAYRLYLERGGQDGHDVEDWLGAEAELLHDRGRAAS